MADEKNIEETPEEETTTPEPEAVEEPVVAEEAPVAEAEAPVAVEEPVAEETGSDPVVEVSDTAETGSDPAVDSEPAAEAEEAPAAAAAEEPVAAERKAIVRLPKPEHERGRRQERRGVVVSSAMDKTIVVKVDLIKSHPKYKKVVRRSVKFHAHDEQNAANVGDVVRIVETRPLSKTKNWRLAEIVEVAK